MGDQPVRQCGRGAGQGVEWSEEQEFCSHCKSDQRARLAELLGALSSLRLDSALAQGQVSGFGNRKNTGVTETSDMSLSFVNHTTFPLLLPWG